MLQGLARGVVIELLLDVARGPKTPLQESRNECFRPQIPRDLRNITRLHATDQFCEGRSADADDWESCSKAPTSMPTQLTMCVTPAALSTSRFSATAPPPTHRPGATSEHWFSNSANFWRRAPSSDAGPASSRGSAWNR